MNIFCKCGETLMVAEQGHVVFLPCATCVNSAREDGHARGVQSEQAKTEEKIRDALAEHKQLYEVVLSSVFDSFVRSIK